MTAYQRIRMGCLLAWSQRPGFREVARVGNHRVGANCVCGDCKDLRPFARTGWGILLSLALASACAGIDDGSTSSSSTESEDSGGSGELEDDASSGGGESEGSSSSDASSSSSAGGDELTCGSLLDCYQASCFDAFVEWAWCTRQTTPPIPERCVVGEGGESIASAELNACFAMCGWDGPEGPVHVAARLVLATCEATGWDAPACVDAVEGCQEGGA